VGAVQGPADALPSGFWTIATRDDGARQWAYQGYPVYTNANDKKPATCWAATSST